MSVILWVVKIKPSRNNKDNLLCVAEWSNLHFSRKPNAAKFCRPKFCDSWITKLRSFSLTREVRSDKVLSGFSIRTFSVAVTESGFVPGWVELVYSSVDVATVLIVICLLLTLLKFWVELHIFALNWTGLLKSILLQKTIAEENSGVKLTFTFKKKILINNIHILSVDNLHRAIWSQTKRGLYYGIQTTDIHT